MRVAVPALLRTNINPVKHFQRLVDIRVRNHLLSQAYGCVMDTFLGEFSSVGEATEDAADGALVAANLLSDGGLGGAFVGETENEQRFRRAEATVIAYAFRRCWNGCPSGPAPRELQSAFPSAAKEKNALDVGVLSKVTSQDVHGLAQMDSCGY